MRLLRGGQKLCRDVATASVSTINPLTVPLPQSHLSSTRPQHTEIPVYSYVTYLTLVPETTVDSDHAHTYTSLFQ